MNLLLDTCTFLWLISDSPEISKPCRALFQDQGNIPYLSSVSIWEIVVKYSLGRLLLPEPPQNFVPRYRELHGIVSLPLDEDAVLQFPRLPEYHKDPFDRMLICQAISNGLCILTPDPLIARYPVRTAW